MTTLPRSVTPHNDRSTPLDQTRSKTPSEDGRGSPRSTGKEIKNFNHDQYFESPDFKTIPLKQNSHSSESRSPRKHEEGVSPTPSPVPQFPQMGESKTLGAAGGEDGDDDGGHDDDGDVHDEDGHDNQ